MTTTSAHKCPLLRPGVVALLVCSLAAAQAVAQPSALDRILFDPHPLAPEPTVTTTSAPAGNGTPDGDTALGEEEDYREADIGQYLETIAREELANGPFAPELMEQFLGLGMAYQEQGEHEAALEALGKAEYISRINSGLYAPEQFAIIESMIESHLAEGDLKAANERQQYLLFLNRQYYGEDSLQVVPALATLADWNMDAFRAMLNQKNESGFAIGLNTRSGGTGRTPNPRALAFFNLYQAQGNYYRAIVNLINNRAIRLGELLQLESSLVEAVFLGANREGIMEDPDFYLGQRRMYTGTRISRNDRRGYSISFLNGRNAYERMRIYQEVDPSSVDPVAVGNTLIGLADWHMLFDRRLTALDLYRDAHRYLREHEVPEETIAAMLNPAVPQQLPVFTPLPHSRAKFGIPEDSMVAYSGYLDVSFRITRFGNVRNVEVLGKTENVSADVERRLRRLLRSSPFRPRLVAGEPATNDSVTLRYYVASVD